MPEPVGGPARRPITGTYRLQLHAGFTFADAERVVPYLAELGVSHLYLSPVLQAAPGSMHGYDVVDHTAVSAELGGRHGLESLASAAHEHGLGVVVDVVPNHMAIAEPEHLNAPLWDVLRAGRSSAYAAWFDVDWDLCNGRIGLPLLGDKRDKVIGTGELVLDVHESLPVLRYHDHVFPVAEGTMSDDIADVLVRQHYLLASWREKDQTLGYRRFFDVDTLIAIRVEFDEVFDATHALLLDLYAAGVVDGFRIDHPDGLADPEGYLARLREATAGGWVVVEKILEADERLPSSWATNGSTGYDAANVIQAALTPDTGAQLDQLWRDLSGDRTLHDVEQEAKHQVVTTLLRPEVERLTRRTADLSEPSRPTAMGGHDNSAKVREAWETLLAQVEVYRAYLRPGTPADPASLDHVGAMVRRAADERPDLAEILARLQDVVTDVESDDPVVQDLLVRFQQVTGPAMAKGVEDTTFYRFNRLLALNEVGGDPGALDSPGPARLHAWAEHQQAQHPFGLTALSTHDTKRSEDVRARLLALAADPAAWAQLWSPVAAHAADRVVDAPTAYLLFQTLVGAWPIDQERLTAYLVKAMREAKRHTDWNDPDEAYEHRVLELARTCLGDEQLRSAVQEQLTLHATDIRSVTLAAKTLQLTLPGVPDVYQGCEAVALTLVDPDNRRPVDHVMLQDSLRRLRKAGRLASDPGDADERGDSEAKLLVTSSVLRLRRDRPELFGADANYLPLPSSSHLLAFAREHAVGAVATVVRRPSRTREASIVEIPPGRWTDLFTGLVHDGGVVAGPNLHAVLPVAVLLRDEVTPG